VGVKLTPPDGRRIALKGASKADTWPGRKRTVVEEDGLTADTYRRAARERVEEARLLNQRRQHAMAHYAAGLAVECMLRAYLTREGQPVDTRHDLGLLWTRSNFLDYLPGREDVRFSTRAALGEVRTRWSNLHRYRDETALLDWLKRTGTEQKASRASRLQRSSRAIVDAALEVVTRGELAWRRSPRGWR